MVRFILVRHSGWKHMTAVHHLFRRYQGESIDGEFVMLKADVDPANMPRCEAHPDMFVLPSIYLTKTVAAHAHDRDRKAHFLSLQKMGVTEAHTTAGVAGILVDRYGAKFSLEL